MAREKRFSSPLRIAWLTRYVGPRSRILDFGCGHGRILAELLRSGYKNIVGIDFSFLMLKCCRSELPDVTLVQNDGQTIPLQKHSVDLVLLCHTYLHTSGRGAALCPGGLLYISDLLLSRDLRNHERYDRYAGKYWTYGMFELPEGVVVRHHRKEWIEELTDSFGQLEFEPFEVRTMNGNKSQAFQYLCRVLPSPK